MIVIRKSIMCIVIFLLLFALFSSGCTDNTEKTDQSTDEPTPIDPSETIVGIWINQGSRDNNTYAIVYEFFSNLSYFTGLFDGNTSTYTSSSWGTYEVNDTMISFYENEKVSSLKYDFSKDLNNLVLYFTDEQYIILTRSG